MTKFAPQVSLAIKNTASIRIEQVPPPESFPYKHVSTLRAPLLPGALAAYFEREGTLISRGATPGETNANIRDAVDEALKSIGASSDGYAAADPPDDHRVNDDGSWSREGKSGMLWRITSGGVTSFAMNDVECEFWLSVQEPD